MNKISTPTKEQKEAAQQAARYILRDKELRAAFTDPDNTNADTTLLQWSIAYNERIFRSWMTIETIQYIRIGGTNTDTHTNDRKHDRAGNYAYNLIIETTKKANKK